MNFLRKFKRKFIIRNLTRFFIDEESELVLKHLRRPFSFKLEEEALCNLFRLLSLKRLNQDVWKEEYDFFIRSGMLEAFNTDTKLYIKRYLSEHLTEDGNIFEVYVFDLALVPKQIKLAFPLKD